MSVEPQAEILRPDAGRRAHQYVCRRCVVVLLDQSPAAERAFERAIDEAGRLGTHVTALLLVRRPWWSGVGTANLLPVGELAVRDIAKCLTVHYGADLMARGDDLPRLLRSMNDVRAAIATPPATVVAPFRIGRSLQRTSSLRNVPVIIVR